MPLIFVGTFLVWVGASPAEIVTCQSLCYIAATLADFAIDCWKARRERLETRR